MPQPVALRQEVLSPRRRRRRRHDALVVEAVRVGRGEERMVLGRESELETTLQNFVLFVADGEVK